VLTTTYNARGLFEGMGGDDTYVDDTYVSSTSYTATGGIDQQVLGNGVFHDFTYDATSNRLERIYTAKPGFLALVRPLLRLRPGGQHLKHRRRRAAGRAHLQRQFTVHSRQFTVFCRRAGMRGGESS
jgi:hypothetical protein